MLKFLCLNFVISFLRKSTKNGKQPPQQVVPPQGSQGTQRPNKAALQAMIANLNENNSESESSNDSGFKSTASSSSSSSDDSSPTSNTNNKNSQLNFSNRAKLFLEEEGFASESNLGELSRISVNNSNLSLNGINDDTIIDVSYVFLISSDECY